ncbi:MAG TPA: undecaprenyl-diphosphate phosphatase [Planctomycetota bacterium]|nr:undecaprenyl-diphosphate phosphatase [Planctomycetota bacterium]
MQLQTIPEGAGPSAAATFLLALVQGLTEFLPVSSSGHLVLIGEALDIQSTGLVLDVALHLGTLIAVVAFYRRDLLRMLLEAGSGGAREIALLFVASLPAAIAGLALHEEFSARFHDGRSAAFGLLATAVVLAVADRVRVARARGAPPLEEAGIPAPARAVGFADAVWIGIAQAVAILPGVSRSGTTISVGMMLGLAPERAARFSFLMSIPVIGGAVLLEGGRALRDPAPGLSPALVAWGVAVAALVGWAALRVLLAFVSRGAFAWFALYCAVLGAGYLFLA